MGEFLGNTIDHIIPCTICKSMNNAFEKMIFSNGTENIRRFCGDCGYKINFASQDKPFIFYFGKYKGKNLEEVYDIDPSYLQWCLKALDNTLSLTQQKKIKDFLISKESNK